VRLHGTYNNIDKNRGDGKITGDPRTLFAPVTQKHYDRHLSGEDGLGIAPIRDDSMCTLGAIDIDVYDTLDHTVLAAQLQTMELPLVVCRSKSGGAHLYLFCTKPVAAAAMQGTLRDIAARIGQGRAEVFPKQVKLDPNSKSGASWINLPYFNVETPGYTRYAVRADGHAYTFEEFLDHAEAVRVGPEFFGVEDFAQAGGKAAAKTKDPLPDGPPCLNHLIQIGFPIGTQDIGIFNLGIYMRKAHPSNWAPKLEEANTEWVKPQIASSDMHRIIGSLGKTEYKYGCKNSPLLEHCNAQLCRRRKYGVGDSTTVVVFGELRKLMSDPVMWFWDVNAGGKSGFVSLTTAELQDPRAVQRKCMDQIDMPITMPKQNDWIQYLQEVFKTVVTMAVDLTGASTEGQFWDHLETFCTGQVQAIDIADVLMGKPFTDMQAGRTYFRMVDLMAHLAKARFTELKVGQVAKVLAMADEKKVENKQKKLKGKPINLWSLNAFPMQTETHELPESLKHETLY
jgi:hypothetical protein